MLFCITSIWSQILLGNKWVTSWHSLVLNCSQYYTRFKSYCCEAYNILRKSSNLILNLFHLMAGSNIPDIASDPEKGILKVMISVLYFVFRLKHIYACITKKVFFMNSSKRNSDWIWMTRIPYISSKISSMKVLVHCFLKWLRQSIGGLSIGVSRFFSSAFHGLLVIMVWQQVSLVISFLTWVEIICQFYDALSDPGK